MSLPSLLICLWRGHSGARRYDRRCANCRGRVSAIVAQAMSAGVLWAALAGQARTDEAAPSGLSIVHLANGDHAAGKLTGATPEGRLLWQAEGFLSPFQFSPQAVDTIQFPLPREMPDPEGEYRCELADSDVLFGTLVSLNASEAVFDSRSWGRMHVARAAIQRLSRWKGASLVFHGPRGLPGWENGPGALAWAEEGGKLVADKPGAVLRRDFGPIEKIHYEIELSWTITPDFVIAFGVGADPKIAARAFRWEIFDEKQGRPGDRKLVLSRETESLADVAVLAEGASVAGPGRVAFEAYLDQPAGRMLVCSSDGSPLADMTVATSKQEIFGGLQLLNKQGNLRLERLRISRWDGDAPRTVESGRTNIYLRNGSVLAGQIESFSADTRRFVARVAGQERVVSEDELLDAVFPLPAVAAPPQVRALHVNGARLGGELVKVDADAVWLKCAGIQDPLPQPFAQLQSLVFPRADREQPSAAAVLGHPAAAAARLGRLVTASALLHGSLTDGRNEEGSCLIWQPVASQLPSRLEPGVSARIVYRDPPPPKPRAPRNVQAAQPQPVGFFGAIRAVLGVDENARAAVPDRKVDAVLHLRSGDMLTCTVTAIDEQGVRFESPSTDVGLVPHAQIQALELRPDVKIAQIPKVKKERLLVLPRMQRDSPPTQLVRSVTGDYLRGRLQSLDAENLVIEIRLAAKKIPRKSVARIIWLHPDGAEESTVDAAERPSGIRVQAVLPPAAAKPGSGDTIGNRLTFFAEQIEGQTISGHSEFLANCRADLGKIDQLLLGAAIDQAASGLAFHKWKLTPAPDPLAARQGAEGSEEGAAGQESALVGKPAPDFDLEMVDGKRYHLADHQDKIVVLDFWASWCGPCLQTMPQVDKVVREFADQGVELVAVNLEEPADRVSAALERLQLSMPVALDRDGRTAERYGATSIPQTVIVDRGGKVARLFVGGSARFDEQLRASLRSVLPAAAEPKAPADASAENASAAPADKAEPDVEATPDSKGAPEAKPQ